MSALLIGAVIVVALLVLTGICRVAGDCDQDEEDRYGVELARRS